MQILNHLMSSLRKDETGRSGSLNETHPHPHPQDSLFKISQPKLDQNSIPSRYSKSTHRALSDGIDSKKNLKMREPFEFPAPYITLSKS
jgi:hypothetical protein